MTHAAVVVRKSTRDEAKVSLAQQEARGRELALAADPTLPIVVYGDEAKSGVDMERPGWQAFVDAVRRDEVALVACYEQSRLTRAGIDTWDQVCVLLHRAGITEVLTYRQGPISVVEGNRLTGRLLALVDQEERERTTARVRDGHRHLREAGRPSGGRPYGYRWGLDPNGHKTFVIDPDEATVIERIAADLIRGRSQGAIARDLDTEGVPSPRGKGWSAGAVKSVVTKPTVAGYRAHRGEIVGPGTWDPILPLDTYNRVAQALTGRRVVETRTGPRTVNVAQRRRTKRLLSPVGVCGRCGDRLIGGTQLGRGDYGTAQRRVPAYTCRSCGGVSIRADHLDDYVTGAVLAAIVDPKVAKALKPVPPNLSRVARQLADIEAELAALGADYGAGRIDRAAFGAAHDGLHHRAGNLRRQLEVETPVAVDEDPATIPDRWDSLELANRQAIVARLLDRVVVHPAPTGNRRDLDRDVELVWRT